MEKQTDKFLEELGIKSEPQPIEPFEKPIAEPQPEVPPEGATTPEDERAEEMKARSRRERRLLEKNQQLREEAIAAEARYHTLADAQKAREGTQEAEYLSLVERIYGTDTPEKREATEILKKGLQSAEERAYRRALESFETRIDERERAGAQEVAQEERVLEADEEYLEDARNADFGNKEFRERYYAAQERLSRKDQDGNILEYADPDAVMDFMEAVSRKDNSKAKELASRNMVRSGQSQPSQLEEESNWREVKDLLGY